MLPCKDAFASALEQLAQSLDPHESECHKRLEVIETLNKTLSSAFPPPSEVVARPYGSFISGFFTATSDLDIALQGKVARSLLPHKDALDPAVLIDHGDNGQTIPMVKLDYRERQVVLEHTAKAVQECASNSLNNVDWRALTARIPLVRMIEVHNNLQVDVCCGSAGSAFKSNVISHISSTEPRMKQLFHLVRNLDVLAHKKKIQPFPCFATNFEMFFEVEAWETILQVQPIGRGMQAEQRLRCFALFAALHSA